MMNAGLGRARNAAHAALAALLAAALAVLAYAAAGFAIQGYPGSPSGFGLPFLGGLNPDASPAALYALFGVITAALAAMIPPGGGGDRWSLGALSISTALFAGITFPLFARWTWGGGWLAQLGAQCGWGRGLVDAGGSGAIHAAGGLTALAVAWTLGPRRGKYGRDGMPAALPGHNAVLVLLGCFLAWLGWVAVDCAGAVLFTGIGLARVPLVALNATLAAAAAALAAAVLTHARFGKTDASLCANAWIAGIASGAAGSGWMPPAAAVLTGVAGGALAVLAVELLEVRLFVDDPGGAVAWAAGGVSSPPGSSRAAAGSGWLKLQVLQRLPDSCFRSLTA
jgi:Amt family ammonium transporter